MTTDEIIGCILGSITIAALIILGICALIYCYKLDKIKYKAKAEKDKAIATYVNLKIKQMLGNENQNDTTKN